MRRPCLSLLALAAALSLPASAQTTDFVESALVHPRAGGPFPISRAGNEVLLVDDELYVASGATTTPGAGNRDGTLLRFSETANAWSSDRAFTIPSPGTGGEQEFADAFDIESDVMVVTAPGRRIGPPATNAPNGAAFTYRRASGDWLADAEFLQSPVPSNSDQFGRSVATNGAWIAIGAWGDSSIFPGAGAVHVYQDTPTGWEYRATLTSPTPQTNGFFGVDVAMSGDVLVVGESGAGNGEVQVFRLAGGTWTHAQELVSDFPGSNEQFGSSVDVDGDGPGATLAIGALASPSAFQGAVILYEQFGSSFIFGERFGAPFPVQTDRLGSSIAVDGDLVVAGAPFNSPIGASGGAAHVFQRVGPLDWELIDVLFPAEARPGAAVGSAVSIQGETIAVGATGANFGSGAFGGCWTFEPIPDDARLFGFGDGAGAPCPCGNDSRPELEEGCRNVSNRGGQLIPNESASVATDDLEIDARNLNGANIAILFEGTGVLAPAGTIGNGLLFTGGTLRRRGVATSDAFGIATWGPGLISTNGWNVGQTLTLQAWYRDVNAACVATFNATSAVELTIGM